MMLLPPLVSTQELLLDATALVLVRTMMVDV